MKASTAIFGTIGLGFILIILSYFIDNDIFYYFSIGLFTSGFIAILIGKLILPLLYWIFLPVSGTYKVKQFSNYSGLRFKTFYKKKDINFKVKFYDSCWYDVRKWGNHINKLYGFGNIDIHENSDRIGWRPAKEKGYIDLFYYDYRDGKRTIEKYKTIKTLRYFSVDVKTPPYKFGRHSFFYYGGKPLAHQDMVCDIVFL